MSETIKGLSVFLLVVGIFVIHILMVCHFVGHEPGFTHEVRVLSAEHVVVTSVDDWFGGTTVTPYWLLNYKWTDDKGEHIDEKDAVAKAINKAVRRYEIQNREWVEVKE